jgi:hypothetical protein
MRTMWVADGSNVNSDPYVSALFPERIDSVVLGCSTYLSFFDVDIVHSCLFIGDGRLRRISFDNLFKGKIISSSFEVSDIPLNGYITTLHLVENDRTKEMIFVGGADDGSLAFWSSRSVGASFSLSLLTSCDVVPCNYTPDGYCLSHLWPV